MKDTATICRRLVELEERAASLYLGFARRFRGNGELSWFWLEMSMEEKAHALLLEFCGCEQLVQDHLPEKKTIEALSDLFSGLEKRARRRALSLDDAFLVAAELEASEINRIYADLIGPIHGTSYVQRKKIETLVPDHMKELIRAARRFRVSPSTVAKMQAEIKRAA